MDSASPIALVTGATSGIGHATALALLEAGYHVAAVGRDRARLDALAFTAPQRVSTHVADLADPHVADGLVAAVLAEHGRLDALVNAAGVIDSGPIEDVDLDRFDRVMDVNVRAVYALSRAAVAALARSTKGAGIVNISSVASFRPFPNLAAYCVSKAAVDHLTRAMAIELAPRGVRVNAVNPGVVVTELHRRGGMTDEAYSAFLERGSSTHPLGRVGSPEEIAGLVLWLLSPAASWITGETVAIDGGRHLTALR